MTTTYHVHAGDDLQAVLNEAQSGDIVLLQAGAQFVGNFHLPPKQGTPHRLPSGLPGNPQPYHIVIRSDASDDQLPKPGYRVDPQQHAAYLPKLVSKIHGSTLHTDPPTTLANTWAYWLIGIELTVDPTVPPMPDQHNIAVYEIVSLGDVTQTDLKQVPCNLVFDRCYIHGNPGQNVVRGVGLNSADTIITECYISDFHLQLTTASNVPEAQAIQGQNGPGPYTIVNCYLEAGEINVFFGGGDPAIGGLVPSDIHVFGNYVSKPLKWKTTGDPAGYFPGVKNLFELKSAQRVRVEGNIFEHVWMNRDQPAGAIGFGPRNQNGSATQSTVRDVTFSDNIIRSAGNAISIFAIDDTKDASGNLYVSQPVERIVFQNNLFYDIDGVAWGGDRAPVNGRFLNIEGGAPGFSDMTFDHNTCFQSGAKPDVMFASFEDIPTHEKIEKFTFTNNIATGTGKLAGDNVGEGPTALNFYFNNPVVAGNILPGVKSVPYPANNFYPATVADIGLVGQGGGNCPTEGGFCSLAATSPYKGQGTDGKDPGCNIAVIMEKTTVAATGHRDLVSTMKSGAGSTAKGQNWHDYIDGNGIQRGVYLDIDTSAAGFSGVPTYVSAIVGDAWHYATTGGSAIYNPTATSFRVYVRWSSNDVGPNPPNPPDSMLAKKYNWYVNWIGWQP